MGRNLWIFCGVGLLGCGAEAVAPPPVAPEVLVIPGAPTPGQFALSWEQAVGRPVDQIGLTGDGAVLVAGLDGVFEVGLDRLEPRSYYRAAGDPETLGVPLVLAARAQGGAYLGTDQGLFLVDPLYVSKSPLTLDGGRVLGITEQRGGPLDGLWLATSAGLFRKTDAGLVRVDFVDATGPVSGIAIEPAGQFGLVVVDEQLLLLEAAGDGLRSDRPPLETGRVHGVGAGPGVAYAATDHGLFRYQPQASPPYTQFLLAAAGSAAPAVRSVVVDSTGATWALRDDQLLLLEGDRAIAYPTPGVDRAVVDRLGDVWATAGSTLLRRGTSEPSEQTVTFNEQVRPWVSQNCAACHRNQTQDFEDYQVFRGLAEAALLRVRSGDMPRCQGSLRCPSEQRLDPTQYSVLEQWIRSGLPE